MSEAVYMLAAGPDRPRVWPFLTEAEAEEFKETHGLVDYSVRPVRDPVSAPKEGEHRKVCVTCGEEWPCLAQQAINAAERALHWAMVACAHCGKPTNGCKQIVVMGAGAAGTDALFHGRRGPCRTAAKRAAHALGRDLPTPQGDWEPWRIVA